MGPLLDPTPRQTPESILGEAFGKGLSKVGENIGMQQKQSQLAKLLFGEEGQQYAGLPAEQQLKVAEQQFKQSQLQQQREIEEAKLQQPKAPLGGLSGLPVPPEISQAIPRILNENKTATADELAVKLDEARIPRAFSNSYIENRRRQDEQAASRDVKVEEMSRKEQLEFHKEGAKYDEGITKKADSAERKIKAIERQKKLQPNISNWDRFVAATSSGTRFEDLLKSQSSQEFDSLALPMIEGQKENFGVRLSDADLRLIMQKIATSTKNPEANKSIMEWQFLESKLDVKKRKIADEIKKENKGLRPLDFDAQIRQRLNEQFGDEIQEKADEIMALEDDAEMVAKIGRTQVAPGTPLTNEVMDRYLEIAKQDPKEAGRLAREDGYEF